MDNNNGGWNSFDRLSFDKKAIRERMRNVEGATQRHVSQHIVDRLGNLKIAKRKILIWLGMMMALLVAVALQVTVFTPTHMTTAGSDGGTYAEAGLGPISTLNPLYMSTQAEAAASRLMFSSLYTYDTSGHLHTDVARGYEIDKTEKEYTVHLRDDVLWHDGTKLNADDIVYTINIIKNPETRAEALRINWLDVSVDKVDDYTVRFTVPAQYAAFPYALTFPILPKHELEVVQPASLRENKFSQQPLGSGPFKFRLMQSDDVGGAHKVVHMAANDKYYQGKPKLGRFELHAYGKQQDIVRAVRLGEVSGAADMSIADTKEINNNNYVAISKPINSGMYLLFNMKNPILTDKNVRKALQAGTDTTAIRKKLGAHIPRLDLPFVDGQLDGDMPSAPAYDIKRAGQLLDEAGWKREGQLRKKDRAELMLTVTTTKDSQATQVLEALKENWTKLGIKLETNVVDTSQPNANFYQTILRPRNYDILLYELLIGADPDVFAYWHSSQTGSSGYNFSNYADRGADASLESARARLEPELRNAKYRTFASQWLDDAPAIGLYQQVANYVINKNMSAITADQTLVSSADRYSNVLYWTVENKPVYQTP